MEAPGVMEFFFNLQTQKRFEVAFQFAAFRIRSAPAIFYAFIAVPDFQQRLLLGFSSFHLSKK